MTTITPVKDETVTINKQAFINLWRQLDKLCSEQEGRIYALANELEELSGSCKAGLLRTTFLQLIVCDDEAAALFEKWEAEDDAAHKAERYQLTKAHQKVFKDLYDCDKLQHAKGYLFDDFINLRRIINGLTDEEFKTLTEEIQQR